MKLSRLFSGGLLILFPWVQSFESTLGLIALLAVVNEVFRPASLAAIVSLVQPEPRKAAYSLNCLAINLGMSIGPLAGGFIFMLSYPLLFGVDGATSLAANLFLLSKRHGRTPHTALAVSSPSRLQSLRDTRSRYVLLAIVPVALVFFQHNDTLPDFLVRDLHLPESAYGMSFTVNSLRIVALKVSLKLALTHPAESPGTGSGRFSHCCRFWRVGICQRFRERSGCRWSLDFRRDDLSVSCGGRHSGNRAGRTPG